MSVVVAIKENGRVYIGADSQVTAGGSKRSMLNPNNYKIWKVKDSEHCFMAHVGRCREANIVRTMTGLIPEINRLKDNVDYDFVVRRIVPRIWEEMEDERLYKRKNENKDDLFDSSFIFAYKDKLFTIDDDGCVMEIDDYCTLGSGSREAMGTLISTDGVEPAERIKKAIMSAAVNNIFVDYPIIITDTESEKTSIIGEENK